MDRTPARLLILRKERYIMHRNLKRSWLVITCLLSLILIGCSSDDSSTPTATAAIATATEVAPTATTAPVKESGDDDHDEDDDHDKDDDHEGHDDHDKDDDHEGHDDHAYPMTVTDMMGQQVTIESEPTRIVSISPTASEMLYAVGGVAVGRDSASTFSEEVLALPEVGGAYNPSVEAIVALGPDLIIMEVLTQGHLAPMLGNLGAPILAVRATSVKDVTTGLSLVGSVIDNDAEASAAIQTLEDKVSAATATDRGTHSVLILIADAENNTYAALPASYPGEIANSLSLTNVAAGMDQSGPYPGFASFSAEQAITSNPDIILTITPAPEPAPRLSVMLRMIPGFNSLAALNQGKVGEIDPSLFLQAPGPRIGDAIETLGGLLDSMTIK